MQFAFRDARAVFPPQQVLDDALRDPAEHSTHARVSRPLINVGRHAGPMGRWQ
ncbi:hypothetical protein ACFQ0G_46605 [Streptomyces chiangmaiensis]